MPPNLAQIASTRAQAIVDRLPEAERTDNPIGRYFLIRRKIFGQVATILDPQSHPVTMIVARPDPTEREALLAIGHPYFSRGAWDDRLGRIAMIIDEHTNWNEVAELLTESYRLTAPKKLVALLDSQGSA